VLNTLAKGGLFYKSRLGQSRDGLINKTLGRTAFAWSI